MNNEDKRKPLTDDRLMAILNEKGYQIARRTVAKYREQLGLPVARLTKGTLTKRMKKAAPVISYLFPSPDNAHPGTAYHVELGNLSFLA